MLPIDGNRNLKDNYSFEEAVEKKSNCRFDQWSSYDLNKFMFEMQLPRH